MGSFMKIHQHALISHQATTTEPQNQTRSRRRKARQDNSDSEASEYDFLVGRFISKATLDRATFLSTQWQVPIHQVLIACGWISQADYTRALAEFSGVQYIQSFKASRLNLSNIPDKIHEG